jgi:flavin-dependent dehydrogenase
MKRVAVLGGGPAGAFAAERLASAGLDTIVIDEKLAWEKPCGGGITYKAYRQYPFLIDNDTPKKLIRSTTLTASSGSVDLELTKPLVIYSRYELNGMLLKRAERAGATLEKRRIAGLERRGKQWIVKTRAGKIDADFCFIAMGARNPLRNVGTQWASGDTMTTLGYFVPVNRDHVDIQFFPQFEGYIWSFPRDGHLSVGIGGKGLPGRELRARLESWMVEHDMPIQGSTFFGHVLPALERPAWRRNRVAGEGWMAVGDAGGLVDPVTGEGLYYAFRSAELATKLVLSDAHSAVEQPSVYRSLLHRDFTMDLELAAHLAKRLFLGEFLYSNVPGRLIQFMRRSPTLSVIVQDLFAGTQNYLELKERLMSSMRGTVRDLLMSVYLRRVVPGHNQA